MKNYISKIDKKFGKALMYIIQGGLCASIIGLLVYIGITNINYESPNNELSSQRVNVLNRGWVQVMPDGTRNPVEFPLTTEYAKGEYIVFECVIPEDVSDHDWLGVRSHHQDLCVYIDGELRESFVQDKGGIYRKAIASRNTYTPVFSEDAGKTLRFEFIRDDSKKREFAPVYYGQKIGMVAYFLKSNASSFILAVFFAILGIICMITGCAIRIATKNEIQIDHLGWGLFLVALWDVTQSEFRDMIFANIKSISIVPSISLLLFPVAFALYFNNITKDRYRPLFGIYTTISLASGCTILALQINRIHDFYETLGYIFTMIYLLFAIMIYCIIKDKKSGNLNTYRLVSYGLYGMAIIGSFQIYTFVSADASKSGTFLCAGACCFVIFALVQALRSVMAMDMEKKAALRTADMKTQFLASMSHEIRTPINAVLGMNEAILRESSEENILGYASDVNHAGKLLLSLINDILDFSKLDSGKMTLVMGEYKLTELISSVYNLVSTRAKEKNLDLKVQVQKNMPNVCYGDEVRIQQVITNLMTNAVKYTNRGMVSLNVFGERIGDDITLNIHVTDTGIGIKDEDRDKLFSAFARLDESKNKKIEGTGLGLAITYQLVKLMGGEITIDSRYGAGSTFMVSIPQKCVGDSEVGDISFEQSVVHSQKKVLKDLFIAPDAKILVVDDVAVNLKVVTSLLKSTQLNIETTQNPLECLELVKKNKYDCILLDHMMPVKDGIETFREMKSYGDYINKDTPVIMLTANAITGAKEEYIVEGFADYVSKPFSVTNLQKALMNHIAPEKIQSCE